MLIWEVKNLSRLLVLNSYEEILGLNLSISDIYDASDSGKTADLSEMSTPPVAWYRMGD